MLTSTEATRTEIHKFGGTSVDGVERLRAVAGLIKAAAREARIVVVVSAMAGVTDMLAAAASSAVLGEREKSLGLAKQLLARHQRVLSKLDLADSGPIRAEVYQLSQMLTDALLAVMALGELTPRVRDRIIASGEKLSARMLVLALRERGVCAAALDADSFLETNDRYGDASPLPGISDCTIAAMLCPYLARGELPVVTGFCGRAPDGDTTTLGRGGSDFSATTIAGALGADEVTIWTDVDGVYNADPGVAPDAQRITHLNYREAAELSYYGAKVLHPRTIMPAVALGIPIRIRGSFAVGSEGTTVDGRFTPGSHPVKAISAVVGQSLISVEGKGLAGAPGVATRVFRALRDRNVPVSIISQSSAAASISLVVPALHILEAELALKREFRQDITHGEVEEVVVRQQVGVVAVVGLGMAHTPGVSARVFGALGRRGINVLAIAQGSSEPNISLVVDGVDVNEAVRALHEAFGLHRLDTGDDAPDGFDLLLLGCGKIGQALVELVLNRRAHLFQRFGLNARIVAIADRGGYLLRPRGIGREELSAVLEAKAGGRALGTLQGATGASHPMAMVGDALRYRLVRPVLVDVSDAADSGETFQEALRLGCDVVTANKQPLAGSFELFQTLTARNATGRTFRAEATVGAGLPVIDTLEMLVATGDRLTAVEGCLSGSLGFLMSRMEEGEDFSEAVAAAVRLGYAEPDPVTDLSGVDVARKALILGRLSGLVTSDTPLKLDGLVDPLLAGTDLSVLLDLLKRDYDVPMAARVAEARRSGKVLRFLARIAPGSIDVGMVAVPLESPIGGLSGSDNLILFRSERYCARPLVVIGPGAGVEVTAMGVLSDILRIAAERR